MREAAERDLSYPLEYGGVFEPLRDRGFLRCLRVTRKRTIVWPNDARIAPETLHAAARRGPQPSSRQRPGAARCRPPPEDTGGNECPPTKNQSRTSATGLRHAECTASRRVAARSSSYLDQETTSITVLGGISNNESIVYPADGVIIIPRERGGSRAGG